MFDDLVEGSWFVDCQFAQLFAVDTNVGGIQASNQTVVAQALGAAGDVDAGNPEFAEFTLFGLRSTKALRSAFLIVSMARRYCLLRPWVKPLARFMTRLRFWVWAGPLVVRMNRSPVRRFHNLAERPSGLLDQAGHPSRALAMMTVTWSPDLIVGSWGWTRLAVGVAQNVRATNHRTVALAGGGRIGAMLTLHLGVAVGHQVAHASLTANQLATTGQLNATQRRLMRLHLHLSGFCFGHGDLLFCDLYRQKSRIWQVLRWFV